MLKTLPVSRISTPWGVSDFVEDIGQGIVRVYTPSHGGYKVPKHLLAKIGDEGRAYARAWSGSEQWFEEDCAWSYVAVAFPDLFSEQAVEAAYETLDWIREHK